MIKTILLVLLIVFTQVFSFSQDLPLSQRFYFKGQIGYDFPFLKSVVTLQSDQITIEPDNTVTTNEFSYKDTFGSGVAFNAGAGILITENISAELNVFYNPCRKEKFQSQSQVTDKFGYEIFIYQNYILDGTFYGLKPALTFTLPGKDLGAYARVGAILGMSRLEESMDMILLNEHPNYLPFEGIDYTLDYKSRFTAGLNLGLGVEYMFLERLWFFGELEANIATYVPKSASYSNYVVDGYDILDDLYPIDREISFVDPDDYTGNHSKYEPRQEYKVKFSLNSIGINIGLKYTLFN